MSLLRGPGALPLAAVAGDARERAAAILRDGAYQTALPRDRAAARPFELPLGPIELLLRLLLWTALAVLVVLAVVWLARRLAPAPRDAEVTDAAAGRFADAIHALLLDTLEALSRAARLAPSLTSREIVERVPLPPPAREALGGLVAAVEVSRFGGAAAGEADYRACLARFQAFLETYRSAA